VLTATVRYISVPGYSRQPVPAGTLEHVEALPGELLFAPPRVAMYSGTR
jgi:hypothetical protein